MPQPIVTYLLMGLAPLVLFANFIAIIGYGLAGTQEQPEDMTLLLARQLRKPAHPSAWIELLAMQLTSCFAGEVFAEGRGLRRGGQHSRCRAVQKVDGERAGARTQDQRLKRAMLYQLSYPLAPPKG